jgi:hypothetical protein
MATTRLCLADTLFALTEAKILSGSKDVDEDKVTLILKMTYLDPEDPCQGYDVDGDETRRAIFGVMKACGYSFLDGGYCEDNCDLEWWMFKDTYAHHDL